MFQHPGMIELIEEQRRKELIAEAQHWHMIKQALEASVRGPNLFERCALWLAKGMIQIGQSIQDTYSARIFELNHPDCEPARE